MLFECLKPLFLFALGAAALAVTALALLAIPALIVGAYNIRYDNLRDAEQGNAWVQRAPVIAQLVQFHQFDILGTQEGLRHQIEDLDRMMPAYTYLGHGREDGQQAGEMIAIFYKPNQFRALESGRFWLSETPDEPGCGWDAPLPRLCSWAKFERISGGAPFYFFSVHFGHRGSVARAQSAA